jgi:outer membrane protein assembly factor BamB
MKRSPRPRRTANFFEVVQQLQERFRPIASCVFLFFAWLLLAGIASAAPTVTLSKKSGPPTSKILVSGRGFESNVGVDIFFDTKDKALVVTNGKGEFHDAGIYAPRSARPGEHWVTALERNNDKGARKSFLVQTNWSQFHFDPDHGGLNPYENVLNRNTVRTMGIRWSYEAGCAITSSPAVANGIVYAGSCDHYIYALNSKNGTLLWKYLTGSSVESSPSVADGVVYVGSDDDNIYALNAHTGALRWKYTTRNQVTSSPTVVDGVVYVGSWDKNIYALSAKTGNLLWKYATGGIVASSPAVAKDVQYLGSVVYSGSGDGNVYALNAATGSLDWDYATGGGTSSPAVANGLVYVGSGDSNVYALNASFGGPPLWTYTTGSAVSSTPLIDQGVVYVGSNDDNFYALNANTGALLWQLRGDFGVVASAVANGVVYVGASLNNIDFYALNSNTGAVLWQINSAYIIESSPAIVDGMIYVGSTDWRLYAFGHTDRQKTPAPGGPGLAPKNPDLKPLRPDFNVKVSKLGATVSGTRTSPK